MPAIISLTLIQACYTRCLIPFAKGGKQYTVKKDDIDEIVSKFIYKNGTF